MNVEINLNSDVALGAFLDVPPKARGIVIFAHGSGSSRHSSRNQFVARVLQRDGFATLLMDLLTPKEELIDEQTRELRFDIPLLANRLIAATEWCGRNDQTRELPIGYFGASTGAAAALVAAADDRAHLVRAIVSRGGRPDLAGEALERARAPALLIVGAADVAVIGMNETAARKLSAPYELVVVPNASHLFEEPGALEQVADLAAGWFGRHLSHKIKCTSPNSCL